ncbi:MAG: ABC transporter ATP-binding protein [Nitrososphaeria archaeon]|nr:ABC transporter ATP-binding protein [Nitrososphaeria archaeon]
MSNNILSVEDLHVVFKTYLGTVHALNGVYLEVGRGEAVGLVGETGCGKSTLGLSIVRLLDESAEIVRGKIFFNNESILEKSTDEMREIRMKYISLIFQDPTAALNPVYRVGDQIVEALQMSKGLKKVEAIEESAKILSMLGIPESKKVMEQYPHELSGGMRQRVMIAIALSKNPLLLIADEPTSNLDVTIQAQILELISELRRNTRMSLLLITHDMGIVAQVCEKVAVMYAGQVIEFGPVRAVFKNPIHPYTRGLLKVANLIGEKSRLESIQGTIPDLRHLPPGCLFSSRCPHSFSKCVQIRPYSILVDNHRSVACWLVEDKVRYCL